MKHAIILHLYYNDLWEEFIEKLNPILLRGDVDLYVTLTDEDTSAKEKIEKVTSNVFVLPNKGLDVGPFIYVLDKIKDLDYCSITKLHSKKSLHHGQPPTFGINWRNILVDSLIGSEEIYDSITKIIEENPYSMIGSKNYLYNFEKDVNNIPYHFDVLKNTIEELGINIKQEKIGHSVKFSKNGRFFAGTMFSTSHKYLKEIFKKGNMLEFYENLPNGYSRNSNSHAMERIFGFYIEELNGSFYEIMI
jgi:lipopolysaccharide biosynthesis protein